MMARLRRGLVGLAVAGRRLVSGFCVAQDWVPGRPSPQPSPTGRGSKSRPAVEAGRRLVSGFCVAQDWVPGRPSPQPSPTGRGSKSRPTVVALGTVVGLLLVSAALLGQYTPLQAQEEESSEAEGAPRNVAGVRISGLSGSLTYGGRDSFTVEAFNLTTVLAYDVIVSRHTSSLGIGACGTAAQSRRVTGVDSQRLTFTVHGCAAGSGTVTAVVRRSGLTTNEGAANQTVTVTATAPAAPARPTAPNPKPREFTAQWRAPGTTGGAALTGYHVLMRANGAAWPPDSQAKKVGATTRSYTFSGLSPNRIYWFKVKACNGANQTRCSGWSSQASVTLPIDNPGTPRWGSFSADATQIRVTWSAPSYTGGVGLTGYGLRHWRVGASEPSSAQVTVNAQTTSRTFSGLASDTSYRFSIQACNGPNRCSGWTNKDGRTDSAPEPDPPARVGRPTFSKIGQTEFTANWTAPNDHGTAIRGYGLQWRQSGSGWPSTTTWLGASARNRRVDGRAAGTTYVVRVKACNGSGANGRDRCGAWSSDGRVTTLAETAVPQNLDIVPRAGREAVLTWGPLSGTTEYQVRAQILGQADWHDARCEGVTGGRPTEPKCVIDLEYITKPGGTAVGLQSYKAYALRVQAVSPQASEFSAPIVIIDTPIFRAKGASGSVDVTWTPVDSIHGDITAGGSYQVRYRKFKGDHTSVAWDAAAEAFDPTTPTPVLPSGTTSYSIGSLDNYGLYAIQLRYDAPRPNAPAITVFAARDAYAWPSDRAASGGERVGTFPLSKPVSNRTYAYYICSDTFPRDMEPDEPDDPDPPDGIRAKSRAFIRDAFSQWATATTTERGTSLIAMTYMGTTYADYRPLIEPIVNTINSSVADGDPPATIRMHVEDVIRQLGDLAGILDQDKERSEVIFVDVPVEEGIGSRRTKRYVYFSEVSQTIGLNACVFTALACAADEEKDGQLRTDILFNGKSFENNEYFNWDIPSVTFNQCTSVSGSDIDTARSLYSTTVHEAGHALGIRGTSRSGGTRRQVHHSLVDDQSIMNWKSTLCSPTPFDVMAIYALYQAED